MTKPRVKVDELDFRILRELFAGETDSFRSDRAKADEIARRLRTHRNTVSTRMRKLSNGQAFLPLTLEIDASRLGMVGGRFFLNIPAERKTPETREGLFRIDGVFAILAYIDGFDVVIFAEDEDTLVSNAEAARKMAGASTVEWVLRTDLDYPSETPVRLSRIDARLISALLRNARASFATLSKELGATPRTLERRYGRLQSEKIITMLPGGSANIEGMLMAYLGVEVPDETSSRPQVLKRVLNAVPNHYIRNVATRGKFHFFLYGPSLADLEAQAGEVRKIPGVLRVTFRVFHGPYPNPHYGIWLANVLERRATI